MNYYPRFPSVGGMAGKTQSERRVCALRAALSMWMVLVVEEPCTVVRRRFTCASHNTHLILSPCTSPSNDLKDGSTCAAVFLTFKKSCLKGQQNRQYKYGGHRCNCGHHGGFCDCWPSHLGLFDAFFTNVASWTHSRLRSS